MSKWTNIETITDGIETAVVGWENNEESGKTIAVVVHKTKDVEYEDEVAKTDGYAQCVINSVLAGSQNIKRYLLNVTFYAGSNDAEDTDRCLFLLCIDKEITEKEMKEIFITVNKLLDCYDDDEENDFPISYEQGININTLMEGVGIYLKGEIKEVYNNIGCLEKVDNYYVIEQW